MPSVKLNKYVRRQNFDTNRNRRIAHTMKISIITATYNSESTIRHTIESVLMQTHKDIEYIIVDGASTDGTMSIVKEYAPLFGDKLKYISEKDKGLYDAMNKGIGVSTGDIVGILNSDDFYTTTTILERVNNELQNTEIDTVYGDVHYVNSDNLTNARATTLQSPSAAELCEWDLCRHTHPSIAARAAMTRRAVSTFLTKLQPTLNCYCAFYT